MKKFATALVAADAFASVKKIVASLASVSLFFVPASRSAQTQPNDAERELFDLLNHERTANHLPELMRDDALFRAARKHEFWKRSEEHTSELQSRGHLVCR